MLPDGAADADRSSSLCSTRINENGSPTVDGSCRFPYHPEPDQDSIDNKCFKRFRLNLFYHLPEIDTIEILNIFQIFIFDFFWSLRLLPQKDKFIFLYRAVVLRPLLHFSAEQLLAEQIFNL